MAATIPTALSLALAIRDAVPGGSPLDEGSQQSDSEYDDDEEGQDEMGDTEENAVEKGKGGEKEKKKKRGIFRMDVSTGTAIVGDEITPVDDVRSLSLSMHEPSLELTKDEVDRMRI